MGKSIAIEFAAHQKEVILISIERNIKPNELQLEIKEIVSKTEYSIDEVNQYLKITGDKKELLKCKLIIEAMSEWIDKKRLNLLSLKEFINSECIVCSNTSSLSVKEIFNEIFSIEMVFGLHFFNPVNIMKLVELAYFDSSTKENIETIINLMNSIGKEVIQVKDSQGYIVNNILIPMINEAAKLLDKKVASAEDIDKAMKLGANHPIGPLKLADLIGIDIVLLILNNINNKKEITVAESIEFKVKNNELGRKTKVGFYNYK